MKGLNSKEKEKRDVTGRSTPNTSFSKKSASHGGDKADDEDDYDESSSNDSKSKSVQKSGLDVSGRDHHSQKSDNPDYHLTVGALTKKTGDKDKEADRNLPTPNILTEANM